MLFGQIAQTQRGECIRPMDVAQKQELLDRMGVAEIELSCELCRDGE